MKLKVERYRSIEVPIKIGGKVTSKSQKDENSPPYILKIIKSNDISTNPGLIHNFKDTISKVKIATAEIIDIFELEIKVVGNDQELVIATDSLSQKYVCIVREFIKGKEITHPDVVSIIKLKYTKEFLNLLKSLERLHKEDIIHGNIVGGNIFYDKGIWKIIDVYPRENTTILGSTSDKKSKDLQELATVYTGIFAHPYPASENPLDEKKHFKAKGIINKIKDGRIKTATEAIKSLENKLISYPLKGAKFSWSLTQCLIKLMKDISDAGSAAFVLGIIILIILFSIGGLVTGKNPIEFIQLGIRLLQSNPDQAVLPKSPSQKELALSENNFTDDLKLIKIDLTHNDLKEADIKTRQLMLKIFNDSEDITRKSWVFRGSIFVEINNLTAKATIKNKSNNVTTESDTYAKIISPTQKRRVQSIDKIWFDGTQGKHGFYKQYSIYRTTSSDYSCPTNTDKIIREVRHVGATFGRLGWGEIKCEQSDLIYKQILKVMDASDSWIVQRPKILNIFRENGGLSDGKDVPDGYYPIVAGLVTHVKFPQFSKWCGYTEKDLVQSKE